MGGPLEGIKVISCGIWLQLPFATKLLGDLGAQVIKVEERVAGDPIRGVMDITPDEIPRTGRHMDLDSFNLNKRSIALDLRKEKGKEIIYRLVEKADVFAHNFRQGVVERLGIDYETLSRRNPSVIYAQGSGWGTKGPVGHRPSFEVTAASRAGWLYHFGGPEMPPVLFRPGICDSLVGIYIAFAIAAALVCREKTGIGQFIDISALGSLLAAAPQEVNFSLLFGKDLPRRDKTTSLNPMVSYYRCQDEKWLALHMMQTDRYWHDFCAVLGIEELEDDPRFHNHQARTENRSELTAILDKVFSTKPRDEWIKLLEQGGDFIFSPIYEVSEAISDPQVLENEYITEYEHPAHGPTKVVGFPYKFSKTPASIRRHPPEHGEHTEEILLELGYSWDDIVELKESQTII